MAHLGAVLIVADAKVAPWSESPGLESTRKLGRKSKYIMLFRF